MYLNQQHWLYCRILQGVYSVNTDNTLGGSEPMAVTKIVGSPITTVYLSRYHKKTIICHILHGWILFIILKSTQKLSTW